jgi:hypothetical protein
LSEDDLENFFTAINTSTVPGLRDRTIVELFYSSGLGLSELYRLNRDDVRNQTELQIKGRGKGNKSRLIFISDRAGEWIEKYLGTRKDNEKALFISYTNATVKDKRLSISSIGRNIRNYGRIARIPFDVTPMILRHSFAMNLLKKGANLKQIQEMLGQSSLATTAAYISVSNKELREAYNLYFNENTNSNLQSEKNPYSQKRIIDQSIIYSIKNNKLKKICNEINTTPDENVLSLANSIGEGLKWAVWLKAKQKNTKLKVNTGLEALLNEAIANNYFKWNASTRFLQEFRNNFMKQAFDMVRHDEHYIPDIKILNPQIDALEYILKELNTAEDEI